MPRSIIFHYHLFKNAGTSVDALLKESFTGRWVTREFSEGLHPANLATVGQWVRGEQDAVAFSSHTAMLPVPNLEGIQVFPIIFVRHPIDRIASAYAFESKQTGDGFGAVLARNTRLRGYVEVRLSLQHDRQCRNFHVARLAQMFMGEGSDDTTLALRALDALPFVGLVEEFDASVARLSEWLSPKFPGFRPIPVAKNVTRDLSVPLDTKLEQIRVEIGDTCYGRLLDANEGDVAVFDAVKKCYGTELLDKPSRGRNETIDPASNGGNR